MASVVYITGNGADPGAGRRLADPIFRPVATLGACMPNIRRRVQKGDWIFVVSGSIKSLPQYILGGFQVEEKISALEAYARFPEYRLEKGNDGFLNGNIAVDEIGRKHPLDTHSLEGFERRAQNYIVGGKSIHFETPAEIERSRNDTLRVLSELRGKAGNRPIDVIGRAVNIDQERLPDLLKWMESVKSDSR
jgi:Nucleotide modification associated domain 2